MIKNKSFYILIRVLTALLGIFLLFSPVLSLMAPALVYDHLEVIPSRGQILLDSLPMILSGAFILTPNRFFITKKLYFFRVSIFTVLALFFGYRGVQGIYFFITGDKHWMIIPTSIVFIIVGICFPLSIYAKKSQAID